MQVESQTVRLSGAGITLAADVAGPEGAQTILFLHGGGQTRHSWKRALTEAGKRGYRAYSLDLRGHGDSDWSPDGIYGTGRFSDDLRVVINDLDVSPVIVGASLGGLTGLLVASDPPPPVAALILVDVAARLEPEGTKEIGDFMRGMPDGFASLEEAAAAVAAYLPHRPKPKETSGLLRNLRKRDDNRYRWHWDPAFITPRAHPDAPDPHLYERAAARLTIPTLLVRGGLSRVVSKEGAQEFLKLVPHAELVDVAGADHMVAGDANDKFNAAVFDFLERHIPSRVAVG
jgi:pimeloyl-ACP methyl ester carboxylesterase